MISNLRLHLVLTASLLPRAITATATTHQVTVGGTSGLVYTPSNITAAVGDTVQFNFESENHTVTQSSFTHPCQQLAGGVDSGFMPSPNNSVTPAPMMQFQVTTSSPIWMYCAQTGHCGKGMVFAINPTTEESFEAFQAAAIMQNGTASVATSSSSAVAVAAQGTSAVVLGVGTLSNSGGACACSCLCGSADFPSGAGVDAVGGVGGQLPLPSVAVAKKKRSFKSHLV